MGVLHPFGQPCVRVCCRGLIYENPLGTVFYSKNRRYVRTSNPVSVTDTRPLANISHFLCAQVTLHSRLPSGRIAYVE